MENNDITIEEVKKIADEKRKTINPELAQKRLENLAKGREIRKQKLMNKSKPEAIPEPIPEPIAEPKSKKRQTSVKVKEVIPEPVPEPIIEPVAVVMNTPQRQPKSKKRQSSIEETQSFNILRESINDIKELINKEIIEAVVKPNIKQKKIKTPKKPINKEVKKTLDLTISDAQILNIINKDEKTMTKGDEKLNSFIKALQKK